MNQECKAHGARLVVLVFPNTLYFNDLIIQADALQKLGKKEGFVVRDLTEPFMYSGNVNALFLQYHFSAKGHKLVAQKLEDLLVKEELVAK
jgi:lysophospholipase L1-like esterase